MARKPKKNEIKTDGWLNTYADTVTLLLTFFVLLFAMSSLDSQKFNQIATAMQSMFTGTAADSILEFNVSGGDAPIVGNPQVTIDNTNGEGSIEILKDIEAYIEENNLKDDIQIYSNKRGLNIEFKDRVLFDIGKAELKDESKAVLNKVTVLLAKVKNEIIIEGHTDNLPINTSDMPNNFHLSAERALSVLDYFLSTNKGINPEKISAQGYGEYRPIASNDNAEGRAQNRRVNIIVITYEDTEPKE